MEKEFGTIAEAAKYLDISPATLQNWITRKRFTAADGLRHFGGSTRIHLPTLQARAMANELLKGGAPPQVITPRKKVARPRKSRPRVWHFETTEPAETPDLMLPAAAGR
jgi:Helix-turn-helix domain